MKLNFLKRIKQKFNVWNEYKNPLMPYWKVRKLFKRPKCHFMYGTNIWFFGLLLKNHLNPILSINTSSLGWKWKYDDVRHEWDPYIYICLFRKYQFIWVFNWVDKNDRDSSVRSMATWEAILEYLYKDHPLEQVIEENVWGNSIPTTYNITIKENVK